MPSPFSSAEQARADVARRLGDLRKDAQLTGRELAIQCGWHPAKASRIENAKTPPSDADIRAWCAVCGAVAQAADLIAASRTADSVYVEWKRLHRTGMRRVQHSDVPLYERTRQFRVYLSNVVPGLVQTYGYATSLLSLIADFQGTPNDASEAAAARVARSHVIHEGDHRFAMLLEEQVLYHRYGDTDTMTGQLGHLLTVMSLPSVSLGIIPRSAQRLMWGVETFVMFDDGSVQVETLTAQVNITAPGEIQTYSRAFAELSRMAVYGTRARSLITAAIDALG